MNKPSSGRGSREKALFRALPPVEKLISDPRLADLASRHDRERVVNAIRELLAELRRDIETGRLTRLPDEDELIDRTKARVLALVQAGLKTVINGSGTLLHTNLGRARVPRSVAEIARTVAASHVDLEIDLETGRRGGRYKTISRLLTSLTCAQDSLVVNNNAAAVLLTINSLAQGREVIVSRGELVEIGGAFRIPEIVRAAGSVLVEVGTTNRTRISDYERAITPNTALLLKTHTSNYRIVGFTGSPSTKELVALATRSKLPLYEDLGSGSLIDLGRYGLEREPTIRQTIEAGVDLVSFSTDKLLGGPQGGVVSGRKPLLRRLKANHLLRALRVDKVTTAMLEKTLEIYFCPASIDREIPFYWAIAREAEAIRGEVETFVKALGLENLHAEIVPSDSRIGGGACPIDRLPTFALALGHPRVTAQELATRLRTGGRPVLTRVHRGRVHIDFRTIFPEDEAPLAEVLKELDRNLG